MDRKTVLLGTIPEVRKIGAYHSRLHVRAELEIRDTKKGPELSVCGSTYRPGAPDVESCGQIVDEVRRLLADPGATLAKPRTDIERLVDIWDRWHLNGMHPECEHQRDWDTSAEVIVVTYKLKTEVVSHQHEQERNALADLSVGRGVTWGPAALALAALPYEVKRGADQPAPDLNSYREEKRERKTAGWLRPDEHPAGLLGRPCPTCGYKYGSAWVYEPLPADAVKFIEEF